MHPPTVQLSLSPRSVHTDERPEVQPGEFERQQPHADLDRNKPSEAPEAVGDRAPVCSRERTAVCRRDRLPRVREVDQRRAHKHC